MLFEVETRLNSFCGEKLATLEIKTPNIDEFGII